MTTAAGVGSRRKNCWRTHSQVNAGLMGLIDVHMGV